MIEHPLALFAHKRLGRRLPKVVHRLDWHEPAPTHECRVCGETFAKAFRKRVTTICRRCETKQVMEW